MDPATEAAFARLERRERERRVACLRRREPGLWAAFAAWRSTEAGEWFYNDPDNANHVDPRGYDGPRRRPPRATGRDA